VVFGATCYKVRKRSLRVAYNIGYVGDGSGKDVKTRNSNPNITVERPSFGVEEIGASVLGGG